MSKVRLTVAYLQPPVPEAFYEHYLNVHVGLAKAIPGLSAFEWSKGGWPPRPGTSSRYALLAEFDPSPQWTSSVPASAARRGQAAAADVGNFASNGADMFISEVQ